MIVDAHTHVWRHPDHLSDEFVQQLTRARGKAIDATVDPQAYLAATEPVDRAIVVALHARRSGILVPNDFVADFVKIAPDKLIGFLSVDVNDADCLDELKRAHEELGLRGIKLAIMYAGFAPDDPRADAVYEQAQRRRLPVLMHMGTTFLSDARLEHTQPRLVENVALKFPELRVVIAHLAHPWIAEAVVTIRKHEHLYADISALHYRPWQFYNALITAQEYGVTDKLLFGSDYPFTTPAASIEGLRRVNDLTAGTALPRVRDDVIEGIIHRDTLALLGID